MHHEVNDELQAKELLQISLQAPGWPCMVPAVATAACATVAGDRTVQPSQQPHLPWHRYSEIGASTAVLLPEFQPANIPNLVIPD